MSREIRFREFCIDTDHSAGDGRTYIVLEAVYKEICRKGTYAEARAECDLLKESLN